MSCRSHRQTLSRRAFVGGSLTSAGMLAAWPRAFAQPGATDRMNVAIIGAGGIAHHHAANHIKPYADILAVCDVDRQRAESLNNSHIGGKADLCHDYQDVLQRDDIDAVVICTPDHWHSKVAVDALRSGKDVYCEKPLTLTIDEGRVISRVLEETGRVFQVGTQQRSDGRFQQAVALARSGRMGKIKRVTVAIGGGPAGGPFQAAEPPEHLDWDRWLGQAPVTPYIPQRAHGNFRWWYEYSGGKLTDWGAHHVDIAQWALDPELKGPSRIELVNAIHPQELDAGRPTDPSSYNTALSFEFRCTFGGAELVIRDNAPDLGFENGLLFECEDGRFFVNRGKSAGTPVEQLKAEPLPEEAYAELRRGRAAMTHFSNFCESCRDRGEPISDVASHLSAINTCHLANIAARIGVSLEWDAATQTILGDEGLNSWQSRAQREGYEVA